MKGNSNMCATGTSGKTDDRGKSRKFVCGSVLEEIHRDGDRMECSTEIGEQSGWDREEEWRRGRSQGIVRWAVGKDGHCPLVICLLVKKETTKGKESAQSKYNTGRAVKENRMIDRRSRRSAQYHMPSVRVQWSVWQDDAGHGGLWL